MKLWIPAADCQPIGGGQIHAKFSLEGLEHLLLLLPKFQLFIANPLKRKPIQTADHFTSALNVE